MTKHNVIYLLNRLRNGEEVVDIAIDTAIKAVEIATPKRPDVETVCEERGYQTYITCPNCGEDLTDDEPYCPECGQALDWGKAVYNLEWGKELVKLNKEDYENGWTHIQLADDVVLYIEFDEKTGELQYLETQIDGKYRERDKRSVYVVFKDGEVVREWV